MPSKKKKPAPPPFLPRELTRYRHLSESSAYIPYVYLQSIDRTKDLIVVDEQQSSSAEE